MEDDQHSDTIGDLTLADTTLCDILLRILNVVRYPKKTKARWEPTTNQAADLLQEKRDADPDLFPPEFDSWLSRVKDAAHQRNAIVHAAAENRCVACGQVARFKHRGKAVDRSAHRVATLTERFDELTREGVKLGSDVAGRFSSREMRRARQTAIETGEPQAPPQIYFRLPRYECAECTGTGRGNLNLSVGPAVAVMPPRTDPHQLLGGFRDSEPDAQARDE